MYNYHIVLSTTTLFNCVHHNCRVETRREVKQNLRIVYTQQYKF